jgi:hypothetical protein
MEESRFIVADPEGTLFTLTEREARALLAHLQEDDEPLSEGLSALRDQLSEWVDPEEGDR